MLYKLEYINIESTLTRFNRLIYGPWSGVKPKVIILYCVKKTEQIKKKDVYMVLNICSGTDYL